MSATRTATPDQLKKILGLMSDLFAALKDPANADYGVVLSIFAALIDAASPITPAPVYQAAQETHAQYAATAQRAARDWAGFLAAMAAFIKEIMPLIVPLFASDATGAK